MHEHYKIQKALQPILEKVGFTIESEHNQLDYCGSQRTIFVAGRKRILLEWNGEEGYGYAEVWKKGEWEKLPTIVLESKESEFQKRESVTSKISYRRITV